MQLFVCILTFALLNPDRPRAIGEGIARTFDAVVEPTLPLVRVGGTRQTGARVAAVEMTGGALI